MSGPAASTLGSLVEWAVLMTSLWSNTRQVSLIAREKKNVQNICGSVSNLMGNWYNFN